MNIYEQVLKATNGMDGWCEPGKQLTLVNLVLANKPRTIVEIGVWGGKSLFPMAIAAAANPTNNSISRIIAIDSWTADASVQGQDGDNEKWWNNQAQHDLVYRRFMDKMSQLGLSDFIEVRRESSTRSEVPSRIDLLHIDGNHGPQALTDVLRYSPSVPSGGFVVLDDLNWAGGAVGKAAEHLKGNGFIELHPLGTGAVYLKI